MLLAMRRTPEINAAWDAAAQEVVFKHYVNLGIAAATQRGLIVPNIKDAQQLSLLAPFSQKVIPMPSPKTKSMAPSFSARSASFEAVAC